MGTQAAATQQQQLTPPKGEERIKLIEEIKTKVADFCRPNGTMKYSDIVDHVMAQYPSVSGEGADFYRFCFGEYLWLMGVMERYCPGVAYPRRPVTLHSVYGADLLPSQPVSRP